MKRELTKEGAAGPVANKVIWQEKSELFCENCGKTGHKSDDCYRKKSHRYRDGKEPRDRVNWVQMVEKVVEEPVKSEKDIYVNTVRRFTNVRIEGVELT